MAQQPAASDPDADPRSFDEILRDELVCLKNRRAAVFGGPPASHDADSELRNTLFGICFSGGGIRSATFNLGIIQGLAGQGMLKLADYLSTVSGGGYIGSWFHGVVRREPFKELKGDDRKPYESCEDYLACEDTKPGIAGQDPVSFLRKYSNYLSPQLGFLSPDSWVIGTIWLRNTILNQLILFLAIATALMAALCLGNALKLLDAGNYGTFLGILLAIVLFGVVYRINQNTGRIVKYELGQRPKGEAKDTDTSTWLTVILPLWVVAILFSFLLTTGGLKLLDDHGGYFALLALLLLFGFSLGYSGFWTCYQRRHETKARWNNQPALLALFVVFVITCSVVTFALLALEQKFLFYLLRTGAGSWQHACPPPPTELGRWLCILLAPVLTILVLAFGVALQQGLAGVDFSDSAREWYSRLAAKLFIVCACWLAWFAVAAFAPVVVFWTYKHYIAGLTTASLAWIVSTVAGVLSGKSAATAGPTIADGAQQPKKTSKTLELIAKIAPPIALVGILVAMATACWSLLDLWFQAKPEFTQHPESVDHRLWSLTLGGNLWLLLFVFLIGLAAYLLSTRFNINEFSLNHFYKNRLVRCYLGASHGKQRNPNRFTGFDPKDDIPLAFLKPGEEYRGPFAIVNCALNLNHGKELAWQERKASSFVFTPTFCGYVPTSDPKHKGYVRTVNFVAPGGPRIGMAMGISGAAVNPNWGSHTQPTTAFLLTLFNVRLGWWVGNTRFPDKAATPGPRVALLYLISELLGLTDEDSRYLNLSDGGHFENLGLYELARRKCRFIIVGDGEQDDTYQFESLGGAIRKIRVDFGYSVDISPKRIFLDADHVSQVHCAVGTIDYHDGRMGTILYLKASLTGDESYDVLQHKKASPSFPHDTTLNQFFTESMFESYRALGKHLVQKVFHRALDGLVASQRRPEHLEEIFKQLGQRWLPPLTSAPGSFVRHTNAYSSLIRRLAEDKDLKFLDLEVFEQFAGDQPTPHKELSEDQLRKGRLLVIDFIQLMENVYLHLNLEDDSQWLHQENSGWVRLFRHWTKQPTFKEVWESAHDTYGLAFQQFYERINNPQSAPPDCKHIVR